ncbi:MAG: tetratricopeptide repeat protein [Pseudomonadota bacterium]
MSRHGVPGRITMQCLVFAGLALAALAGPASAEDRSTLSRTVLGGDRALQACAQAASSGNVTDVAVLNCDQALRQQRLSENDRQLILIDRGIIHLTRRETEASVADFDAVIQINPRNAEAYLNKGAALVQMGQPGPAVATLTTALSLGVRQPHKAYYNRGVAREALGDLRGAYEDYTTALQIEPDWGPAEAEVARFVRGRQERLAGVLANDPNATSSR